MAPLTALSPRALLVSALILGLGSGLGEVQAGGADRSVLAGVPVAGPALPGSPLRDLALVATPQGGLLLATLHDDGEAHSWRGAFTARAVRVHAGLPGNWRALGNWQALGGVLNYDRPRPASNLHLAADAQGTPVLVWNENYGDNDVTVFRAYQGGRWTDWRTRYLGVSSPAAARTRAVAAQGGEPVLVYGEYRRDAAGRQYTSLSLRRWDDSARTWTRSAPLNPPGPYARSPALALGRRATVAFLQGDVLQSRLLVLQGSSGKGSSGGWTPLGGALNRSGAAYLAAPQLVLDRAGRPVVAWLEDLRGQDALYVSRWTGTRWEALGGTVAPAASEPALSLGRGGQPVVAWVEERAGRGQVWWARWTARGWTRDGPLNADPHRDARTPRLAWLTDPRESGRAQTVLAWREDRGGVYRLQLHAAGTGAD